jgi:hypothetical protein
MVFPPLRHQSNKRYQRSITLVAAGASKFFTFIQSAHGPPPVAGAA